MTGRKLLMNVMSSASVDHLATCYVTQQKGIIVIPYSEVGVMVDRSPYNLPGIFYNPGFTVPADKKDTVSQT